MLRSLHAGQYIGNRIFMLFLQHFLQNGFAVLTKDFMLNIIKHKSMNECFCGLETAVQIDGAD